MPVVRIHQRLPYPTMKEDELERIWQVCDYIKRIQFASSDNRQDCSKRDICCKCPEFVQVDVDGKRTKGVQLCFSMAQELSQIATGTHPFWERRFWKNQRRNDVPFKSETPSSKG